MSAIRNPTTPDLGARPRQPLSPEDLAFVEKHDIPESCIPCLDDIEIDDGAPVDGSVTEKNMRLLTEPLYASWPGPKGDGKFVVLANVGLFYAYRLPAVVPDVMLSLDIVWPDDRSKKENLSYFTWVRGKLPEVAIEIVSNNRGGEDGEKMEKYASIGIIYYAIYDPFQILSESLLRCYKLVAGRYELMQDAWLDKVGLGLKIWHGTFEHATMDFLRWCDQDGNVIPTGAETAALQKARADTERERANAEKLRADQAATDAANLARRLEVEKQQHASALAEIERLKQQLGEKAK